MSDGKASHATVLGTLRETPGTVRVLVVGNFITNLAAFLNAFLVLFLTQRGFSAFDSGVAFTALMVGRISGTAVGGAVADRIGYRLVIVWSMIGSAVLTALLVHAPNLATVVVVALLAGIFNQAYRPAAQAWVVELTPMNRQVMVFSFLRLTFNLGSTLGPLGAALVLVYYSYNVLFYADATGSLVFGLVALVALRSGPRQETDAAPAETGPEVRAGYRQVLSDGRFVLFVVGLFLTAITYIQLTATLPLFVTDAGYSKQTFALLLAINGFVVIVFEVLLSKWTQRLPIGLPMSAGMALLGIGYLMYLGPSGIGLLAVATVVWTFGEVVATPSMMAYPGMVAPPGLRGRYIAAATVPQQAGYSVGPLIGVAAWEWWGEGVWLVVGPFALVAAVLTAIGAGLRRRPEPAPEPDATVPDLPDPDVTRPDLPDPEVAQAALLTPPETISEPAPEPLTLKEDTR
ncbi:MFS transporter [Actinomadura sp. DC4]|uniref:MFS transporter n=1 Tax=Actinomadura sp. DC4 TaxID=3055069 RepID=UPI0025B1574D|nr:MFS transporter [Actinomadura sp. DC4]MDN3352447.1 MFS transporter [Actinomadura sp. DC4]